MTTVLIIDDEAAIVALLVAFLETEGYTVLGAVNGAALPLAVAAQPDVVLLDIMMPGMDGLEVARRLRADARTRAIPIALMSAGHRLAEQGRAVAVDRLLAKPFDLDEVLGIVEHLAGEPTVH